MNLMSFCRRKICHGNNQGVFDKKMSLKKCGVPLGADAKYEARLNRDVMRFLKVLAEQDIKVFHFAPPTKRVIRAIPSI